jgi:hypothetical protein
VLLHNTLSTFGLLAPRTSFTVGMQPLLQALMQRHNPALPYALCQGDILTQDSEGSHNDRHPLEDGQEESSNTDE